MTHRAPTKPAPATEVRTYTLRGERITSLEAFYDEVQEVLCGGWGGFGRNLDALVDALRGGLGGHEYGARIRVVWADFHRSAAFPRKREVIAVFEEAENVEFVRG